MPPDTASPTDAAGPAAAGNVDAVVLLHGQPGTSAVWLAVRSRLDLPVLVPDRPGYGTNPEPATDYPGNVAWLLRFLDRAGVDQVVVAGHSWAGGVALLAAARHPDRIRAVALVSSVGPGCLVRHDLPLAWPVTGEVAAFLALRVGARYQARRVRRMGERCLAEKDMIYAEMELAAQFHRPVWRSFLAEQRALVRQLPLVETALGQVRVPTAVLAGTLDTVIPSRCPAELVARVPGAYLCPVDGAGHELPLERPDTVATTIRGLAA